jgi:hypothetical protein
VTNKVKELGMHPALVISMMVTWDLVAVIITSWAYSILHFLTTGAGRME